MKNKELQETLIAIGRTPGIFYRDTPMLLQVMEKMKMEKQPEKEKSKHSAICEEYWERGLECRCIPESVKRDIRNGANPEDLF